MEIFLKFGRLKRGCVKTQGDHGPSLPLLADAHGEVVFFFSLFMHLIQRLLFGLHLKLTKRHRIRGKDVFLRFSPKFRRIVGPYHNCWKYIRKVNKRISSTSAKLAVATFNKN